MADESAEASTTTGGVVSNENSISSVRYYALTDENVRTFYDDWKFKTLALIRKKGHYAPFLIPATERIPTDVEVIAPGATAEQKALHKANMEAHDQVLMGCTGIPLGLVKRANGDVRDAIKNLDEKYAQEDASNLIALIQQFTACKLEDTETDPDGWFLKIDQINNKMKAVGVQYEKKDFELKAHLLGNLPEGYEDVKTKVHGKESEYTVREIEKEISNKWKRDFHTDENTSKKAKNLAMTVTGKSGGTYKKFKGKCRSCGKIGHKSADCKSTEKVKTKGTFICFKCGEQGHYARDCPTKGDKSAKKDEEKGHTGMFVGMLLSAPVANVTNEPTEETNVREKYLIDTGAGVHVVASAKNMVDIKEINETVTTADKTEMVANKEGTLYLKTNEGVLIRLDKVKVVPDIAKNIISVGLLMDAGNKVEMEKDTMLIKNQKNDQILIKREQSPLYYLEARRVLPVSVLAIAEREKPKTTTIDINDAHELYGHCSEGPLKALLKQRNVVVTGTKRTCEACAYAKAKAKSVGKTTKVVADAKGDRLFLDISGPYKNTSKGSKFWILIVDDKTRKAWSFFVTKKNDIKKVTTNLVLLLKGVKVFVKYLRCDNAGENVKGLGELCRDYGIALELTAPHTPQMNGVVERKFVTLRDRAQAMMLGAKLDDAYQAKLWAEAVFTATKLHNAVPNRATAGKSPDELWYGETPKLLDHLIQWGRIGYVKNRGKTKKLDAKSTKMVCMGYADDHAGDVYRMYNTDTETVIATRDITWADWHGSQDIPISLKIFAKDMEINLDDDSIGEDDVQSPAPNPFGPHVIPDDYAPGAGRKDDKSTTVPADNPEVVRQGGSTRAERELARLNTSYNPTLVEEEPIEEVSTESTLMLTTSEVYNIQLASDPGEPKSYTEALKGPESRKWIVAMKSEIENFIDRKVWTPTKLEKLRARQKPIRVKWVFKKKNEQDGTIRYKGRIVVKGFVQIPGIDFTLTHSPVAQESSIKIVLALALMNENWSVEMIDIEAAFLEADMDEEIYIEWPEGVKEFGYFTQAEMNGRCLRLEKAMYGCVQSPLMFFKEMTKHLREIGLSQSLTDPCIWFLHSPEGELIFIIAVYVDDCILTGEQPEIDEFKKNVQTRFNISDLGQLKKHLGVWYERCKDKTGEYYKMTMKKYQDDIVLDWEQIAGGKAKKAKTPGFPGETLRKNTEQEVDKENYRKILGRLMWFTRKLMPECGNPIRELAISMDNPGQDHWRSMSRLVGYIANTDTVELRLMKPKDLKVYAYVDSNYATDTDNRKSVTGYVITIGGCLISWSSKSQPSVTLSSTEAEYVAASMCSTEIKFIQMLLEELMPTENNRPATLFEDNTGAMFLMENQAVGARTKHIDIRWHHMREMMTGADPRLRVLFTKSENNFADVLTKNVTEGIHLDLAHRIKDGRISNAIFDAVEREDVSRNRLTAVKSG
jgi:hypothetical protein